MRKVKFFGNNIEISCDYCAHSKINNEVQFCTINRVLKNGKCKKFIYNPIMRKPKKTKGLPTYKPEDFLL